ncbi:MAG: hypothetical protein ABIJ92_00840 [Candidatus Aenigmatarchaeota archaeon]
MNEVPDFIREFLEEEMSGMRLSYEHRGYVSKKGFETIYFTLKAKYYYRDAFYCGFEIRPIPSTVKPRKRGKHKGRYSGYGRLKILDVDFSPAQLGIRLYRNHNLWFGCDRDCDPYTFLPEEGLPESFPEKVYNKRNPIKFSRLSRQEKEDVDAGAYFALTHHWPREIFDD